VITTRSKKGDINNKKFDNGMEAILFGYDACTIRVSDDYWLPCMVVA